MDVNVHHSKLNLAISKAMRPFINQPQATSAHTEAISPSINGKPILLDNPKSKFLLIIDDIRKAPIKK